MIILIMTTKTILLMMIKLIDEEHKDDHQNDDDDNNNDDNGDDDDTEDGSCQRGFWNGIKASIFCWRRKERRTPRDLSEMGKAVVHRSNSLIFHCLAFLRLRFTHTDKRTQRNSAHQSRVYQIIRGIHPSKSIMHIRPILAKFINFSHYFCLN